MIRRCHDTRYPRYKDWGGRGIKVCDEWRADYFKFQADVGEKPGPQYQLDRIDNDGNYGPNNVEWVLATKNSAYGHRRLRSDNTTGAAGVSYNSAMNMYTATITVATRRIYLGWYRSKNSAIRVRKNAEELFQGMIE